jgi:uncharacterized protein (TIGR03067 family)
MWRAFVVGTVALLYAGNGEAQEKDPLADEWICISTTFRGSESREKGFTARFSDGKATFTSTDGKQQSGTYTFDLSKAPATIDLVPGDGPDKGKIRKGIFAVDKQEMKLCFNRDGQVRPTAFSSKTGDDNLLFVLQRVDTKK